jgi:hypothetical protein
VYQCPTVTCPADDAGSCAPPSGTACSEPPIPSGCSLGSASCVNGVYQCPPVICPSNDGGSGNGQCVEVDISTYDTSCTTASDCIVIGQGDICADNCGSCPTAPVSASEQARYNQAISGIHFQGVCACPAEIAPSCVRGKCVECFPGVDLPGCSDAGTTTALDAGPGFACGGPSGGLCNPLTEYCYSVVGGPISPDGGTPESFTCKPIPGACANDPAGASATCACIEAQLTMMGQSSGTCHVTDGDIEVDVNVP